jgi:hypothetical protein
MTQLSRLFKIAARMYLLRREDLSALKTTKKLLNFSFARTVIDVQ